ncbi:unnamed protein product [Durusdinium trenchii]|uniref:Uncharacterized protein n=1 Tax=Durusdinium trenchii TaxID=1381693 RepID=A0ABP0JJD9_9DINO
MRPPLWLGACTVLGATREAWAGSLQEPRVVFSANATRKVLAVPGLQDGFLSLVVPRLDLKEGDVVEVATELGKTSLLDVAWTAGQILSKRGTEIELRPLDEQLKPFWFSGVLFRRFPWRYVALDVNDAVEVCTTRGWELAHVQSIQAANDSIAVAFEDGETFPLGRPWVRRPAGNVLGSMDYAQIAVDDKVKVETSRGWEMAKVLHKEIEIGKHCCTSSFCHGKGDSTLDLEMCPDGERFSGRPRIVGPIAVKDQTLKLWKENHQLRAQVAELSALKSMVESISVVQISMFLAQHKISGYVQEMLTPGG